eukprot:2123780-Rhodomonas_salina.1
MMLRLLQLGADKNVGSRQDANTESTGTLHWRMYQALLDYYIYTYDDHRRPRRRGSGGKVNTEICATVSQAGVRGATVTARHDYDSADCNTPMVLRGVTVDR